MTKTTLEDAKLDKYVTLSAVQSKILLVMLAESGRANLAELLIHTKISGSSWIKEKKILASFGLLQCSVCRKMTQRGVARRSECTLTDKGKKVAQQLASISNLIADQGFPANALIIEPI